MKLRLHGRFWRLIWAKRFKGGHYGDCDPPNTPKKVIRILKDMKPEEELRLVLHECLHACGWWADEEWVDDTSSDISHVLWRLGWRKVEGKK
jgi:hypothetical protein